MAEPGWTPDGVTVNEDQTPGTYDVGTFAVSGFLSIEEFDFSAISPAPTFIWWESPVQLIFAEML